MQMSTFSKNMTRGALHCIVSIWALGSGCFKHEEWTAKSNTFSMPTQNRDHFNVRSIFHFYCHIRNQSITKNTVYIHIYIYIYIYIYIMCITDYLQ